MSLIDKFFLYNMPPEEPDEEHDEGTSQGRAEELRRRLYQNYFTTNYAGVGGQRPGASYSQRNALGGEFDDARNTAESEWIDGDVESDWVDGDGDDGQRTGSNGMATDEEDAMLMTDTEKEQFAAQLSSLEERGGSLYDGFVPFRHPSKSVDRAGSESMYERNNRWKQRLAESTDMLRDELSQEQTKDCTFSPAINRKPVSRTSSDPQAQKLHEPAPERLQKAVAAKNARLDELRKSVAEKELQNCTFRPKVVRSSWVRGVTPRYLDDARNPSNTRTDDDPALAQCSFTPQTNRKVIGGISQHTSEYLAAPAHDRLSRDAAAKIRKQRELETTVSTIGAATASSTPSTSARSKKLAPTASFFERMTQLEKKKLAHRIELEQELRATTPFKPVISTYKPPFEKVECSEKSAVHYHRDCAVTSKPEEEFTGRPEINPASRQLPRTIDDLHNSLRARRNKIKKLERQYKAEEMREATFSPKVSRFSHETGGKLAEYLNKGVESYTLFVEMQKTMKEKKLQQLRSELESRDQAELTFHPEVHKAPALIQEMAAEVRRAREASKGATLPSGAGSKTVITPFRF